jgi:hypothetical protein
MVPKAGAIVPKGLEQRRKPPCSPKPTGDRRTKASAGPTGFAPDGVCVIETPSTGCGDTRARILWNPANIGAQAAQVKNSG